MAFEASCILAGMTIVRWVLKTKGKNEFDPEVAKDNLDNNQMIEICKFCQIIKNGETLCY